MEPEKVGWANVREGLAIIWRRHLAPFRRELGVLSVLGVFSALANGTIPYVTGRFFDALVGISLRGETLSSAGFPLWASFLAIWAVVQFLANSVDWAIDRKRRSVDVRLHLKTQVDGFLHLFRLPVAYHKGAHVNGVLQSFSAAGWRIAGIARTAITIAPEILGIAIGITLAASINLLLAGVLLAGVTVYAIFLVNILRPIAAIDHDAHEEWMNAWNESSAAVHQIESIKQATAEEYESKRSKKSFLETAYLPWSRMERIWSNVSFVQRMVVFATQLTVFILSANFVTRGIISVGELIALNGYALMFFGPLVQLGYSWQLIQNGITAALKTEEVFREPVEVYTPPGAVAFPATPAVVEFRDVRFRYEADQPLVLDGVSFSVKPGEVVALVGESGVGKSTIAGLLSAYYFPTEGALFIGGVNTRMFDLLSLRSEIAVVPQEVTLFNESLRTNIAYGTFDADDTAIARVAEEAHLAEFVATLPKGYDTLVGERGIKLSVGQKQRVAIARAMLRDPKILILDEPTSALDAKTEKIITGALERLMKERTTFVIAHRLSTVRKADRILVFKSGKLVEEGTHKELLKKKNGVYRELHEYQVGLY